MTTDKQWEHTLNSPDSLDMLADMATQAMLEAEQQMQGKGSDNQTAPEVEPGKVEPTPQTVPDTMPSQTPTEIEPHTQPSEKQDEKA